MSYLQKNFRGRYNPRAYNFPSPKPVAMAPPTPAPPPPTIDQAVDKSRQNDMIRQRKGAASNILAGTNPGQPTTMGVSSLLGA